MRRRSNSSAFLVLFIVFVVIAVIAYRTNQVGVRGSPRSSGRSPETESVDARIGPRDIYPDPVRTPGAVNPDITQDNIDQTICNPEWSTRSIRPPAEYTNRLKFEQMEEYGDSDTNPRDYEEDHLIPLELGGSNVRKNLWPQHYDGEWNAARKDRLERRLHAMVCGGELGLKAAQDAIARDWVAAYQRFVVR